MSHKLDTDRSVMDDQTLSDRARLAASLRHAPLPEDQLLRNLGLYLLPMDLKRILFFDSLYRQILQVPGIIVEFGCRWGQSLAILQSLRSIYEPYHHRRRILGFDTFQGFPAVSNEDGTAEIVRRGAYGVSPQYEQYLTELLALRETQSPLPQVKKFEVIAGDASETFPRYLQEHPETIIAMAYFDMDLYQPTADCLQQVMQHVTCGSVIGFDELNHAHFPGETRAVDTVLGLANIKLQRNQWCADECFFVV